MQIFVPNENLEESSVLTSILAINLTMPFQHTFANGAQMTGWDVAVLQLQSPAYVSR